jgi:hypothetical protein
MFFKDFVSVKRQKIKRGASQTYDTPSFLFSIILYLIFTIIFLEVTKEKRIFAA